MLVYSVNSKQSFDMVRILRDKILNHLVSNPRLAFTLAFYMLLTLRKGADWVPLVIVGNKCDLKPELRHVPKEHGQKLAEEFKCSFAETSARNSTNVTTAFESMIAEIEKSQNPAEPTGGSKCILM